MSIPSYSRAASIHSWLNEVPLHPSIVGTCPVPHPPASGFSGPSPLGADSSAHQALPSPLASLETPDITVIDRSAWIHCFGQPALDAERLSFEGIPSEVTREMIRRVQDLPSGVRKWVFLQVPAGLTLNALKRLATSFELTILEESCCEPILEIYGNNRVDRAYQVALSESIFTDSAMKGVEAQQLILEENHCVMPRMIEVVSACALKCIKSLKLGSPPVRLYADVSTRCEEKVDGLCVIAGGFGPEGLYISPYSNSASAGVGIAGTRNF